MTDFSLDNSKIVRLKDFDELSDPLERLKKRKAQELIFGRGVMKHIEV